MGNWLTNSWLLISGLVCIFAAIVGRGFRAFRIELPALLSLARQKILAIFGVTLVAAATITPRVASEVELLDTKNDGVVRLTSGMPPPEPAKFTVPRPYYVTYIWNYHYNNSQGVTPGNISLRRDDGKVFGPWEVTATNDNEKINWEVKPNTEIPAGTYTIIDSENERWSWNTESKGRGLSKVKGRPAGWQAYFGY
jgi:hypothetical protein